MDASLQSLLLALESKDKDVYALSKKNKTVIAGKGRKKTVISKNRRRRRARMIGPVERRLRTLQKLVPGGEMLELDGLFREAADYIACLQSQVMVMRIMVNDLSGDSDDDE